MSTRATGSFETKSWDESAYEEIDSTSKLSRASVSQLFRGDIEGEATSELLLAYPGDGSASFVGLQRIVGTLGSRSGSFVLEGTGTYAGGTATMQWSVVPGSGTAELRGLRGDGGYVAKHDDSSYTLDYSLDE